MSKKLKALAEKATPGPWVSFVRTSVQAVFGPDGVQPDSQGTVVNWPGFDSSDQAKTQRKANARYIAAANPAVILQLLAERDALLAERDSYKAWYDDALGASNIAGFAGMTAAQVISHQSEENAQLVAERDVLKKALDAQSWEIASPNISYALREQLLGQLAGDHEPDEMLCAEDFHDWLAGAIDRIRTEHRKAEGNQAARVYASAALQGEQP